MDNQIVTHINLNGRYRVVIERAASTKGVLGYKIEANSDTITEAMMDIDTLRKGVERIAVEPVSVPTPAQ